MKNGLVRLTRIGKSIRQMWVKDLLYSETLQTQHFPSFISPKSKSDFKFCCLDILSCTNVLVRYIDFIVNPNRNDVTRIKCVSVIKTFSERCEFIHAGLNFFDKRIFANQSGSGCLIATEVHDMNFTLLSILNSELQEYFQNF